MYISHGYHKIWYRCYKQNGICQIGILSSLLKCHIRPICMDIRHFFYETDNISGASPARVVTPIHSCGNIRYPMALPHRKFTHWGRATHICVSKLTIIGSEDGLSPGRRKAIIWINAGILLTHWGRVTHICVNKLTIIVSDNGLSPGRRQAIIWNNAGILLIGPLGINFSEILIKI